MKRIIFVYGIISGLVIIASMALLLVLGADTGRAGEVVGYLIMLVALSMIFIGIKKYRDNEQGGVIRFTTALAVGFGIAAVSSVIYVLGWEVYMYCTDYTFFDSYAKALIEAKRAAGAPPAEIAKLSSDMAEMGRQYAKPLYRMIMTFCEILPVGVVVTLISAAVLRKSKVLPAI